MENKKETSNQELNSALHEDNISGSSYSTGPHIEWWNNVDRFAMLKKYGYQDKNKPWKYRELTNKGIYIMWSSENLKKDLKSNCMEFKGTGGSFLFEKALLDKATINHPEYVMGIDTYDKDALAYCFGRKVDGVFEVMLSKTMRNEKEFKQEVENLAKYFNADVFRSGD